MSAVVLWEVGIALVQVYAAQRKLLFQVEMVVDDDVPTVYFGDKAQQALREDSFRRWFSHVKRLQAFVEKRRQYLVLFNEEMRGCHYDELHPPCPFAAQK